MTGRGTVGRSHIFRALIGVAVLLIAVESVVWFAEKSPTIRNLGSDTSMWLLAKLFGGSKTGPELGFIEMDDNSARDHEGIGRTTNREFLTRIIKGAIGQAPKAVIVDVDLSLPGNATDVLRNYLRMYNGEVPLVLIRALRPYKENDKQEKDKKTQTIRREGRRAIDVVEEVRDDGVVDEVRDDGADTSAEKGIYGPTVIGRDHVFLASTGFLNDADGGVRRSIVAEPLCKKKEPRGIPELQGIPSAELLALAILASENATRAVRAAREVEADVQRVFQGPCDSGWIDPAQILLLMPKAGYYMTIDLVGRNASMIAYTFFPTTKRAHKDGGLCSIHASYFLATLPTSAPAAECNMAGRIVVIGGTAETDMHPTALGKMPGGLLLVNAINSLYQNSQLIKAPSMLVAPIGFLFGVGIFWLTRTLRPNVAMVGCLIFIVVAMVLLSARFMRNGLWLDLGAPILGLIAHPVVESVFQLYRDLKRQGWRALRNQDREEGGREPHNLFEVKEQYYEERVVRQSFDEGD